MAYIKYQDDPLAQRVSAAFANLCASSTSGKKSLRVFDQSFCVFNGAETELCLDMSNFVYPVDNQNLINFEVCADETLVLFDNQLTDIVPVTYPDALDVNYPLGGGTEYIEPSVVSGPSGPSNLPQYDLLTVEKNYVRGIILRVNYSSVDKAGDDVIPADQKSYLRIWSGMSDPNVDDPAVMPLNLFFAHFANPVCRDARDLINRIEIVNPSPADTGGRGYSLVVTGLIVYTKSNSSIADCAC